jgi:hypothetical protein
MREIPPTFEALKTVVEALVSDERNPNHVPSGSTGRDYTIKYMDPDNELINVSDDEDLQAAYEVAETDLNGNLKFVVEFKKTHIVTDEKSVSEKINKSTKKAEKKKLKKKDKKKKAKNTSLERALDASSSFVHFERNDRADTLA